MSQNGLNLNTSSDTGTTLATKLLDSKTDDLSNHLGTSRPAYATAGMLWFKNVSSTQVELYAFDGADDIKIGEYDPTNNRWNNFGYSANFASNLTVNQNFISSSSNIVLAPTGAGTIYLRPNGFGSGSGEMQVTSSGHALVTGDVQSGTNVFKAAGTAVVLAPTTVGTVNLRPSGPGSTSGEVIVQSSGNIATPGDITVRQNYQVSTTIWLGATNGAGTFYLRPNGSGSTTGEVRFDNAGNMVSAGAGNLYWNSVTGTIDPTNAAHTTGALLVGASTELRVFSNNNQAATFKRSGSDGAIAIFYRAQTSVGSISVTASATAYNTSSDYRLKFDVKNLVSEFTLTPDDFNNLSDPLTRVMAWRPVSFKMYADDKNQTFHGFLAHELQQVSPHAVTGEKDAHEDIGTILINKTREIAVEKEKEIDIIKTRVSLDDNGNAYDETYVEKVIEKYNDLVLENYIEEIPNVTEIQLANYPGGIWKKTASVPVYQQVDHSKLVADLAAAVQSLTLMVLELKKELGK